jgi:hypothetical protein
MASQIFLMSHHRVGFLYLKAFFSSSPSLLDLPTTQILKISLSELFILHGIRQGQSIPYTLVFIDNHL